MSAEQTYYVLAAGSDDPAHPTTEAEAEAARTWRCPGCLFPKPDTGAIDVRIESRQIQDKPFNFIGGCFNAGLALKSFLDQLGPEIVERDLHLGRVSGPKGEPIEDWVTFRGRRRVIVRGSDDPDDENDRVFWWRCRECGNTQYSSGGILYLYPAPPDDAEIYEDCGDLIVPDYLFNRLEIPEKAKIYFERIKVVDPPLDGFGVIEPWEPDRSKWGIAHRSMRGRTQLTDSVRSLGKRDVNSINRGRRYHTVYWHFFPDPETGRIDVAPDLLQAMERSGIDYVMHGE